LGPGNLDFFGNCEMASSRPASERKQGKKYQKVDENGFSA
jgi:hypothetical protein